MPSSEHDVLYAALSAVECGLVEGFGGLRIRRAPLTGSFSVAGA